MEILKLESNKYRYFQKSDIEKGLLKVMSITFLTDDKTIKIYFYGAHGKFLKQIGPIGLEKNTFITLCSTPWLNSPKQNFYYLSRPLHSTCMPPTTRSLLHCNPDRLHSRIV